MTIMSITEDLYVMNADGSDVTKLYGNRLAHGENPLPKVVWSPNGQQIAFTTYYSAIYKINVDGSGLVKLSREEYDGYDPAWSPDGRFIAFAGGFGDRTTEIYIVNSDGSDRRRLTNNDAVDRDPTWSPDGRSIIFISNRDGSDKTYVMNSDGSDQRQLTDPH